MRKDRNLVKYEAGKQLQQSLLFTKPMSTMRQLDHVAWRNLVLVANEFDQNAKRRVCCALNVLGANAFCDEILLHFVRVLVDCAQTMLVLHVE